MAMNIITPNTNLSTGSVSANFIKDGAVTRDKIADGSINAAKIEDGTVIAQELATDSVTTIKILDANVTTAKILDANITTAKILDANITTAKILDANITTAKILDANVTTAKILDNNITTAKILDNNITTAKILDANVTVAKMAVNSVDSDQYVDGSIDAVHLADGSVTANKYLDDSITAQKIVDNNITTDTINGGAVTNAKLANDAVTLAKIASSEASSNGQVLTYNSASGGSVEWGTATSTYTDANAVDAWEAKATIVSTTTNKDIEFTLSTDRGNAGYVYLKTDELWIGGSEGIVIENDQISAWGSTSNLVLGGPNSNARPIQVDGFIEFNQTTHGGATTTFNQPVEFNNPVQVDNTFTAIGTSKFDLTSSLKVELATAGITTPVLHLEVEQSGWDKGHLLLEDSNDDVVTIVGRNDTGQKNYQLNYTLDPNNTKGRTNVGGTGVTYPGDYFVAFEKNYYDLDEIEMNMKVFGAHNGFNIESHDDSNGSTFGQGGSPTNIHYYYKPINLKGSAISIRTISDASDPVERVRVDDTRVTINNLTRLHNAANDPSNPLEGDVYYNVTSDRIKLYTGAGWKTLSVD